MEKFFIKLGHKLDSERYWDKLIDYHRLQRIDNFTWNNREAPILNGMGGLYMSFGRLPYSFETFFVGIRYE